MAEKLIDKRSHPVVRTLRDIRDGKNRKYVFCEGFRVVEEAGRTSTVDSLYLLKSLPDVQRKQAESFCKGATTFLLSDSVMSFVSDLTTPPGVIALMRRPAPQVA